MFGQRRTDSCGLRVCRPPPLSKQVASEWTMMLTRITLETANDMFLVLRESASDCIWEILARIGR